MESFTKQDEEMKERLEKEKNDAEPIIKDEGNRQIVPVNQVEEYVPEEDLNLPVDQLLSVKNWTMQSHEWKLFNAIFDMLSDD